jgi:hypothetical protein
VPQLVCMGAMLTCTFGTEQAPLSVIPMGRPVQTSKQMAANINAIQVPKNISTFGLCTSLGNPEVVAATAAAFGVLTPVPCKADITLPWAPGSPKVMINGSPALDSTCMCVCEQGGLITISKPGQGTVND